MIRFTVTILCLILLVPLPMWGSDESDHQLEKSAYFAYVGREYIFTIEVVEPGALILNFVSMSDREEKLLAKNIRLFLGNRYASVKLFSIEVDRHQPPLLVSSSRMHPRSSFGFRLEGSLEGVTELYEAEIKLENDKYQLVPLSKFDFETLVRKVNRINLGSPDFRDDFRVLNLELQGTRSSLRR
ncbi:MAG: hypothetical protein P8Z37_04795 [Acidobacteriota bacterium]